MVVKTRTESPGRTLHNQLRERLRELNVNPCEEIERVHELAAEVIDAWQQRVRRGEVQDLGDTVNLKTQLVDTFCGLGPLEKFMSDPHVEEIWINDAGKIFVARQGRSELTTVVMTSTQIRELVERMLRSSGRRLDLSSPFVDAALSDGSRLHAVIPPVTSQNWSVNIRRHLRTARHLRELVELGTLPARAAKFLSAAMAAGLNVLVCGATQSGKTTLLRALCGAIPATERIITCEEVFELHLAARDVVAMQTRPPNLEGGGEINLRRLVKESLRMRPDRIVIGEVREAESLDLLIALNAGLPGACTLHANSARDGLRKLSVLPLLAGQNVTADFVIPTIANALDLVVHCQRERDGSRHVAQIVALTGQVENGSIVTVDLWRWDGFQLVETTHPWAPKKPVDDGYFHQLRSGGEN